MRRAIEDSTWLRSRQREARRKLQRLRRESDVGCVHLRSFEVERRSFRNVERGRRFDGDEDVGGVSRRIRGCG
jgi:hypothetical protein